MSRPYLLAKKCFSLAGHRLASLYYAYWPRVLISASGLQASGMHARWHGAASVAHISISHMRI